MKPFIQPALVLLLLACSSGKEQAQFDKDLEAIDLTRGDITLCGSGIDEFGTVEFSLSCGDNVRGDFNLAMALLHSFEYTEAEKVFASVIDKDPRCVMAYWGVAMSNFHPLWARPGPAELLKGSKVVTLARSITDGKVSRESDYLEAIAAFYDNWQTTDHKSRVLKFESRSKMVYEKYPNDNEAAIFYSLALNAAADPADKTFAKQKKAGSILNAIFVNKPDHPGIAHYIIHNYDYPELAEMALPAARKYASIAAASAHAQHMPSHIFIRLGLWDEAIRSNMNSVSAAQCYAEKSSMTGHWDEELHGMDYLTYAYLQKADDEKALEQINYLKTITEVFPVNFKDAYCFAAMPARYAVERKDWTLASALQLEPANFPFEKFPWERANTNFARLLGAVHARKLDEAQTQLKELHAVHDELIEMKDSYKANLVHIQVKAADAWIKLARGQKAEAVKVMSEAADMEDATAKHPVTPGEIIPARELLADMYLETGDAKNALIQYEADLEKHPNRFNALYGAGLAAERSGDDAKARKYFQQLLVVANSPASKRPELAAAQAFVSAR